MSTEKSDQNITSMTCQDFEGQLTQISDLYEEGKDCLDALSVLEEERGEWTRTFGVLKELRDISATLLKQYSKPASTIVSAVIQGISPIKVEVCSKQPTNEQLDDIDFQSIMNGKVKWIVKSIERVAESTILITFWNGVTITSFNPLYIIEREVSNG